MGMAITPSYPRPKVTKYGYVWKVTWAEYNNSVWYHTFPTWKEAIQWVMSGY